MVLPEQPIYRIADFGDCLLCPCGPEKSAYREGISISIGEINAAQLDFLKEMENIGAANAATSLSRMLNEPIDLRVPSAWFCALSDIGSILGDPEQIVVGSFVEMCGDISGAILFMQTVQDAESLANLLLRQVGEYQMSAEFPTEMQHSALMEMANILCGSYINAVAELTGLFINCSVPSLVIDMAGALMNLPALIYGAYSDMILILETVFVEKGKYLSGRFFLMPDDASHNLLMRKMGLA